MILYKQNSNYSKTFVYYDVFKNKEDLAFVKMHIITIIMQK